MTDSKTTRISEAIVLRGVKIKEPMVAFSPQTDPDGLVEPIVESVVRELEKRLNPSGEGSLRTVGMQARREAAMKGTRWITFVEIYCDTHEARHPGEHSKNVRRVLERFTKYRNLQDAMVSDVEPIDLEQYLAERRSDTWRGRPLADRTINNEIDILNTALAKAGPRGNTKRDRKNFGFCETPPGIDPLTLERKNPVELTEEQQQAFLKALFEKSRAPRPEVCDRRQFWMAVFLVESVAPLRREALLTIPRPVDLVDSLLLKLPANLNKANEDRTFAVPKPIAERLAELPSQPGEPLLPWKKPNGKPYSIDYFSECMREAQRAAGIDEDTRVLLKHFRSTVATVASDEYGDAVGRQLLGHSATTNTINTAYKRRGSRKADRKAAEVLGQRALELADIQPDLKIAEGQ